MGSTISIKSNRIFATKKEHKIPTWLFPVIYHRKRILIGLIVIVLFSGCFALCATWQEATGLHKTVLDFFDGIFGSESLETFKNLLNVSRNGAILKIGSNTINIMAVLSTVNRAFVNIGTCWLLVCWGISFFDMLMQNNNQMIAEQMIRKFLYLIIGLALVQNAMNIVFTLTNMGTEILISIAGTATDNPIDLGPLKQAIYTETTSGTGMFKVVVDAVSCLGYLVQLFIPYIFTLIVSLLVSVVCWSRFIEICLLATVSPVMFADVGDDRNGFMHTSAMRAMKYILSLALSGALIFVSLYISQQISISISGTENPDALNYLSMCYNQVILGVVRLGLCTKATTISKQLVGLA